MMLDLAQYIFTNVTGRQSHLYSISLCFMYYILYPTLKYVNIYYINLHRYSCSYRMTHKMSQKLSLSPQQFGFLQISDANKDKPTNIIMIFLLCIHDFIHNKTDTDRLIHLVSQHSGSFDKQNKDYMDRGHKDKIWEQFWTTPET